MTENKDEKKPKATLIKHQKPDNSPPVEKKKIVVVKKKATAKKVFKRIPSGVDESKDIEATTPLDSPKANSPTPSNRIISGKDTEASPPDPSARQAEGGGFELKRKGGRAGVVAGRNVDGSRNTGTVNRRPYGQAGAGKSTGSRYPRPGGVAGRSRPDVRSGPPRGAGAGTNRPSDSRKPVGAGRMSGSKPMKYSPPTANRVKKFYKAKKTYEKQKEQQERIYQYVKKKRTQPANPIPKTIDIMEVITVSALARKMNLKVSDLISKLMGMGMMVTINQNIDAETATILADDYGCKVNLVSLYDETIIESDTNEDVQLLSRPPIITVMGHVDHGKTKLLDAIRDSDVISDEHGGITQHIGAYMVHTRKGPVTFLDTPGHSAFTLMRARGAQITDLVVLVVAANDGVMPQTIEAIEHAQAAETPIIVAINKIDLPEANPDRVKQQLADYNLMSDEWGGSTQFVSISALNREGIDELLDVILLEAEMMDLKTKWDCRAEGKVIESRIDQGRGIVSTVLVELGTLNIGDSFVAGIYHGKVRAMFDDTGKSIKQATPAMPVEILGLSGVPDAGDPFQITENERDARQFGEKRQELKKTESAKNIKKINLDNIFDHIQEGNITDLKVIIKGDVHGSVEALQSALEKLSTSEIRLVCIRSATGAIIEDDVNLAIASDAIIIGFHVRPTTRALDIAEKAGVDIRKYNVIFEAVDDIKSAMEGLMSPEYEDIVIGQVEIREIFKVSKIGVIAGCMVKSGVVRRKSKVNLLREGVVVHTGELSSLKRFKDDVKEVKENFECGLSLLKFSDMQIGDILEIVESREIAKKLGENTSNE